MNTNTKCTMNDQLDVFRIGFVLEKRFPFEKSLVPPTDHLTARTYMDKIGRHTSPITDAMIRRLGFLEQSITKVLYIDFVRKADACEFMLSFNQVGDIRLLRINSSCRRIITEFKPDHIYMHGVFVYTPPSTTSSSGSSS